MVGREKGFISKIVAYKRYYIVCSFREEEAILFFEELQGDRLIKGDIIDYDVVDSTKYGKCALNIYKTGNIFLNELKIALGKNETIEGYVYEKNDGGYLVSYKGYKCFIPNTQLYYRGQFTNDGFLDTYQLFKVLSINDGVVVLSRKLILKSDYKKLSMLELVELSANFTFLGRVKSVEGYGVFVSYKYSEGLLHITNILSGYSNSISKGDKQEIQKILSLVFVKGRELLVSINSIEHEKYSLNWNKDLEPNKEICEEIKSHGLNV